MTINNTPQLIVQTGTDIQPINLLQHKTWTIGRDPTNLVRLSDRFASRFHAKLDIYENRHCYFWDINSRNGSLINGERMFGPMLLSHGDRVTIGNTVLLLKHNFVTTRYGVLPKPDQQVLMVQASAVQGKIWQEILLSQGITIVWETPGHDLKNLIRLQAATYVLPKLIIIDIKAMQQDIYGLCHWCRQQNLTVKILLMDSDRHDIPTAEQSYAMEQGFLHFFPAFDPKRLLESKAEIAKRTLSILMEFENYSLRSNALLTSLNKLEKLLNKTAAILAVKQSSHGAVGLQLEAESLEDMTRLKVDPRKLKKKHHA